MTSTTVPNSKQAFLTRNSTVCILACICCLLWGSAFPSIKIGYSLFQIAGNDTASQILFAGYRFTLAGILVLLTALLFNRFGQKKHMRTLRSFLPCKATSRRHILILCLCQTVCQYFFFYIGLANTSGVKASIIEASNVFIAVFTASLIFRQETVTFQKILGCVLGFVGVILVNLTGEGFDFSLRLTGEGFIFFSTIAYALSSVLMKQFSRTDDPVFLSGWQFLLGGIILSAGGFLMGGQIVFYSASSLVLLLYLAFISAGAYTLWSILIKYNPVSKVSVYGFMNPVFGVVLSCLLLKDNAQTLGYQSIIALLLVCLGIYIVNHQKITGGYYANSLSKRERRS